MFRCSCTAVRHPSKHFHRWTESMPTKSSRQCVYIMNQLDVRPRHCQKFLEPDDITAYKAQLSMSSTAHQNSSFSNYVLELHWMWSPETFPASSSSNITLVLQNIYIKSNEHRQKLSSKTFFQPKLCNEVTNTQVF